MKRLILVVCSITIATTAFTQIKANRVITKSYEPVKQNTAIIAVISTNRDSIELNQLFEAFKIADADATNKLGKVLKKMKVINGKSTSTPNETAKNQSELEMMDIQQMMMKRAQMMEYLTNMIKSRNEEEKKILGNIR
jgi:hypothetical protein